MAYEAYNVKGAFQTMDAGLRGPWTNSPREDIMSYLTPKGPKAIFRPFLKFGQAIVKAIFIKNSRYKF
jgi:hypothetical protein